MPMSAYLEDAIAYTLQGKSLEEYVAGIGTNKKLYLTFTENNPKLAAEAAKVGNRKTWSAVKECRWGASGYTSRVEWPGTSVEGVFEAPEGESSGTEFKNTSVITICSAVTSITENPTMNYVCLCDSATFGAGNCWFWAKLTNKATVETGSTEGVKFEPKALVVTVL